MAETRRVKGSSLLSAGSSGTVGVGDSVGGRFVAHAWLLGGNGNVSILSEMDSNGLYFHHQKMISLILFTSSIVTPIVCCLVFLCGKIDALTLEFAKPAYYISGKAATRQFCSGYNT